jgi:hypothetical protein
MTVSFRMHPSFQALLDLLDSGALVGRICSEDRWRNDDITLIREIKNMNYQFYTLSNDGKHILGLDINRKVIDFLTPTGDCIKSIQLQDQTSSLYAATLRFYHLKTGSFLFVGQQYLKLINDEGSTFFIFQFWSATRIFQD